LARVLRIDGDACELHRGGSESVFRIGDTICRETGGFANQVVLQREVFDQGLVIEGGWPLCNWAKGKQSLLREVSASQQVSSFASWQSHPRL